MADTADLPDMHVAQLCDWGRYTRTNEEVETVYTY
jgi:hypothetical protein